MTLTVAGLCHGATLPTNLSMSDLSEVTRVIVAPSAVRALRSAEAYASWPGLKFGLESTLAPVSTLRELGAANGSIEGLNIVPRLYFAKGLFAGAELVAVWFPDNVANTLGSLGGLLKYCFLTEDVSWFSAAGYGGFTMLSAFDGMFSGRNVELGAIVSKDLVRVKPFVGAALARSYGNIVQEWMAYGHMNSATTLSTHFFAGIEFEFPMHITVQGDLFNLAPSFSLLISKHI